jgi:hypothetical protein
MEIMKTLWASVQGDPVFMRRVNGWLTVFWIVMIPISIATGWINSVAYVASLSLWALVSGHWSAWQAARVEVKQDEDAAVGGANTRVDQASVRSVPDPCAASFAGASPPEPRKRYARNTAARPPANGPTT